MQEGRFNVSVSKYTVSVSKYTTSFGCTLMC